MERQKFQTSKILLRTESQRDAHIARVMNAPLDGENPLEALLREEEKPRRQDHNAAMWAGPLRDIEQQAWLDGRTFKADVWHEHFKREFLPEEYDSELCLEGYRKWDYLPTGERVLVGSTTQLKKKGFALYLLQVEAFGASLGVIYHANPRERVAA